MIDRIKAEDEDEDDDEYSDTDDERIQNKRR